MAPLVPSILEVRGIDAGFAMQLYGDFCAAGLNAPQMRYKVPIGGGPDWIGYEFLPDHIRSVRDLSVQKASRVEKVIACTLAT
jgi:hypothetical protein